MLTEKQLVEYSLSTDYEEFPPELVERVGKILLDSLGCLMGGYASPPSKHLRAMYRSYHSSGATATVLGDGDELPVELAGLINGAMIRYLDFNDGHLAPKGGCHPSDQIPALLAVAEAEGSSGTELVEAISIAYDVQCGANYTGTLQEHGFDYVPWGVLGTTLGAGKLMGLSATELRDALGMAMTANNSLEVARLGELSMWKGIAQSFGCHNAVKACKMAQNGITGPRSALTGANGFFEVVTNGPISVDLEADDYKILETALKPHAACGATIAAIQSTLELQSEHGFTADDISAIDIETYRKAVELVGTDDKWSTDLNRETADHSLPYTVSIAILDGEVTPRQYRSTRLTDPAVHSLMEMVEVEVSEELDRVVLNKPGTRPSKVTIHTDTDSFEKTRHIYPGHPDEPFTESQVNAKFRDLSEPYLTADQMDRVIQLSRNIESIEDVRVLPESLVV
jgi:2-methylcitrate dehydratase